jgi:HSP20 family protein
MKPCMDGNDKIKKRDNIFNANNDILEKVFEEMQKFFEGTGFKEILKNIFLNDFASNTRFIQDDRIKTENTNKPIFQEVEEYQKIPIIKNKRYSNEQEFPIEVIEGYDIVSITIEIPGIEKEDIKIGVSEKILEFNVNAPNHKYHKFINLPCRVKENSIKTTYKNGIFDVVIKRRKKRNKKEGYKVDIK